MYFRHQNGNGWKELGLEGTIYIEQLQSNAILFQDVKKHSFFATYVGISVLHPIDNFEKSVGRKVAEENKQMLLFKLQCLNFNEEKVDATYNTHYFHAKTNMMLKVTLVVSDQGEHTALRDSYFTISELNGKRK